MSIKEVGRKSFAAKGIHENSADKALQQCHIHTVVIIIRTMTYFDNKLYSASLT
jgi:hypothetical protein